MESATIEEVRRLSAGWKFLPPVHAVLSPAALPFPAHGDVEGAYFRGEVYLVGEHSPDRVAQLIGHEAIAHAGLRLLHGRTEFASFMASVAAGARAGDPTLTNCREHVRSAYRDEGGQLYLPAICEADETAARLGELLFDPSIGPLLGVQPVRDRVRAALRQLKRRFLHLDIPADGRELRGHLLEAEALLKHGPGFRAFAAWWYRPAMPTPKPMGPARPARSIQESEAMIAADKRREDDWKRLKLTVMEVPLLIVLLLAIGATIYCVFAGASRWTGAGSAAILTAVFAAWWLSRGGR